MSAVLARAPARNRRHHRSEPLETGERLTAPEFMRRYEAMPEVKKAELIEGIVYMSPPVRADVHSEPDSLIQTWLGVYAVGTPGVKAGVNGTIKFDMDNVPQPDAWLRKVEKCGGSSRLDDEGYLIGPPELIVEIAASSRSIDLHTKLGVYRRNGVKEYLVWRTIDEAFDWFILDEGNYQIHAPDSKGICRSATFPGLNLNVPALLSEDGANVLAALHVGLKSRAHQAFVANLAFRRK